jgi:flagellar hook-basal body complex protein FliE
MSDINMDALLAQMRAMAAMASATAVQPEQAAQDTDFGAILKGAIDQVNQAQQKGAEMARAFEAGEAGADLVETMITLQKARISFEAMVQVRNKVVQAYQDIMNMPL